jgi:hypothetical protein
MVAEKASDMMLEDARVDARQVEEVQPPSVAAHH